ncbi:MAG: hypothetical protein Q8P92_03480 [Candidatus Daviesbacteria bacterium]|nr:hypothetical protein [Candidatus Daviesbacteria bacterium]
MEMEKFGGNRNPEEPGNSVELKAPSYNPRHNENEITDKLGRQIKCIITSGIVGLITGLSLGVVITSQVELPSRLAYVLSLGIAGMLIGTVVGAVIENWTAPKIND